MKNTRERIRIINAFKKYSRLGLARGKVDPLLAYERIKGCSKTNAQARELIAVYETVRYLEVCGKRDCLDALFKVYFSLSSRTLKKSEIGERVLRYATDNYCDQRTVYRRLSFVTAVYKRYLGL